MVLSNSSIYWESEQKLVFKYVSLKCISIEMKGQIIFAVILLLSFVGINSSRGLDKHSEYRIEDNEIDDSPLQPSKHEKEVEKKPITLIVETIKAWITAIPETIINFFAHLLSPFMNEKIARQKVQHFMAGLTKLIVQELPPTYADYLSQASQFLDMIEMIG